jgi:hypothetical protein
MKWPILPWLAASTLALATPASADFGSLSKKFGPIMQEIYGDVAPAGIELYQNYYKYLLDGIDGDWVPLHLLGANVEQTAFEQACRVSASHLRRTGDYQFVLSTKFGTDMQVDKTYVLKGGNLFGFTVQPDQLFKYLGLESASDGQDADALGGLRINALSSSSGLSTVIRLDADLILFQDNLGLPALFARCQ